MSTTERTSNDSIKPYKAKLLAARKLRGDTAAYNFQRVGLLVEVFNDREFRADLGNLDDLAAGERLDAEVTDLGFEFLQLRAILERFPTEEDWRNRLLVEMWQTVLTERATPTEDRPQKTRRTATVAELDRVKEQAEALRIEVEQLRPAAEARETLHQQLARAHRRIGELEQENAELRAQIDDLAGSREPQFV